MAKRLFDWRASAGANGDSRLRVRVSPGRGSQAAGIIGTVTDGDAAPFAGGSTSRPTPRPPYRFLP